VSDDPGRDLIEWAAAQGFITHEAARSLDDWAGKLATEQIEEGLSDEEVERRIIARLTADIARRGQA
jgi:hypothetical protein